MSTAWPFCPQPQCDESLRSWFERVGREYGMSETSLLHAVNASELVTTTHAALPDFTGLNSPSLADRLTRLGNLPPSARAHLSTPRTEGNGWTTPFGSIVLTAYSRLLKRAGHPTLSKCGSNPGARYAARTAYRWLSGAVATRRNQNPNGPQRNCASMPSSLRPIAVELLRSRANRSFVLPCSEACWKWNA